MTSLAEVYAKSGTGHLRRLYLGTGLFLAGAVMVVIAIIVGTTDLLGVIGVGTFGSREVAGILSGLGVPAVFVGIFTVLPASPKERATAAIGASVAVFGVVLFWYAYPSRWYGAAPDHITLPVVAIYFLGLITTFWSLFIAVVNFKTRNDPGGTVTLSRIVGAARSPRPEPTRPGGSPGSTPSGGSLGGIGVLGGIDRDTVIETEDGSDDGLVVGGSEPDAPASDGGTATDDITSPGGDRSAALAANPDRYCGNCDHFDYDRTDRGFEPYCGFHDERMDDMTPCEQWEPNAPR